jgi:macrodomain Ter protein organizer (MatP/YcbG family)
MNTYRFINSPKHVRNNVIDLGFNVIDRLEIIKRNTELEETYERTIGGIVSNTQAKSSRNSIVEKYKSKCHSFNVIIKDESRQTI